MLITITLISHLVLATAVSLGFVARYIQLFRTKTYVKTGRVALLIGSSLLIASGVTLSILSKTALTSLCLESLSIITALLVLEFGLYKLSDIVSVRSK